MVFHCGSFEHPEHVERRALHADLSVGPRLLRDPREHVSAIRGPVRRIRTPDPLWKKEGRSQTLRSWVIDGSAVALESTRRNTLGATFHR